MIPDMKEHIKNPGFGNFVCLYFGLAYVGSQLETYTISGMKEVHETISQLMAGSLICTFECSKQFGRHTKKWCHTCASWKHYLETYMRFKNVAWEMMESWKWPMSYDTIVEVFVPTICANRPINFQDLYIESYIWANCSVFNIRPFTLQNLRNVRNASFAHNTTLALTDSEKARCFGILQDLLSDSDVKSHINKLKCTQDLFNIEIKYEPKDAIAKFLSVLNRPDEIKIPENVHNVSSDLTDVKADFQNHSVMLEHLNKVRRIGFWSHQKIFITNLLCLMVTNFLGLASLLNDMPAQSSWKYYTRLFCVITVAFVHGVVLSYLYRRRYHKSFILRQKQNEDSRVSKSKNITTISNYPVPNKVAGEWDRCLNLEDISLMGDLISSDYLPNKEQLMRACKIFSRSSNIISVITDKICETIKRKNGNKVKRVWAAYKPDMENHIIFVIVTEESKTDLDFKPEYDLTYRKDGDFSSESKEVILEESDRGLFPEEREIVEVEKCINKHTSKLMKQHSNLTIISASLLKCKGYGKKCVKKEKACIVLHVHIKGLIPLRESVFPTHLDRFEVDVREGCFQLDSGKGPHHKHQNVKMGCGIKAKERDDSGTLGGFLEHPKYGLCALTCAHLFFDKTPPGNVKKTFDQEGIECMQPYHEYGNMEGSRFGMLKLTFTGERRSVRGFPVSLDYALIAVDQNRKPLDGSFPYAKPEEWSDAGFKKYPPTFETGKVIDFHELTQKRSGHIVVKYGSTTILTCGKIPWNAGQHRSIGNEKVWKNQIQINATKNEAGEIFSDGGDSGALVFHADDEENLTAVGLLVGGNRNLGFSLATPICDILADINIQNLKRFNVQDDSDNGIIYPSNSTVTTPENSSFDHCCRKLFAPIISLWRRLFPEQERKPKLKRD